MGKEHFRVNRQHKLLVFRTDSDIEHSRIRFGRPEMASFTIYSEKTAPFDLNDPSRINSATKTTQNILIILHQLETATAVEEATNKLAIVLRSTIRFGLEQHVEEIGILEQFVSNYKNKISKDKVLEAARKLQELQVPLFHEGSNSFTKGYLWTTKELFQYFETGHCPPLLVVNYIS